MNIEEICIRKSFVLTSQKLIVAVKIIIFRHVVKSNRQNLIVSSSYSLFRPSYDADATARYVK